MTLDEITMLIFFECVICWINLEKYKLLMSLLL